MGQAAQTRVHAAGQVANFHLPDGWKRDMAVKNESVVGGKQHGNLESAGKKQNGLNGSGLI